VLFELEQSGKALADGRNGSLLGLEPRQLMALLNGSWDRKASAGEAVVANLEALSAFTGIPAD
jgi:hypothetical protein